MDHSGFLHKKTALPKQSRNVLPYQQPVPQIWLRICQMEPQPVLQQLPPKKKYILPTSFSVFASRRQVGL